MYPAQSDLKLYRGDYFEMTVRLRESVYNEGTGTYTVGDPMDLTGWTGQAQIRATVDATAILASFIVEVMDQSSPDTKGMVHLYIDDTFTATLAAASAVWDFQLIDTAERVHTYLRGKVTIDKDVTRI